MSSNKTPLFGVALLAMLEPEDWEMMDEILAQDDLTEAEINDLEKRVQNEQV